MQSLFDFSEKGRELMLFESIGGGSTLACLGIFFLVLCLSLSFFEDIYRSERYETKMYNRRKKEIKNDIKMCKLELREDINLKDKINLSNETKLSGIEKKISRKKYELSKLKLEYKIDNNIFKRIVGCLNVMFSESVFFLMLITGVITLFSSVIVSAHNESVMKEYYQKELSNQPFVSELITEHPLMDVSTSYSDDSSDNQARFIVMYEVNDKIEKAVYSEALTVSKESTVKVLNAKKLEEYKSKLGKENKRLDGFLLEVFESNSGVLEVSVNKEMLK